MAMNVSVIVPAHNCESTIGECVNSLFRQASSPGDLEVIVVDDGSEDGTARLARQCGARVVSIERSGAAAARNRGVERASGDILLFTDADCRPGADWVDRMTRPFLDPGVTATKGVYRSDQKSLTARFVQLEYTGRYARTRRADRVDFIDTYSAGFRRRQFFRAGGFDERFVIGEDQEFSFRYASLGGDMVFVPDAVVTHLHADSPWRYFRKKLAIGYWKIAVLSHHPRKAISDSHTPQTLKVEMLATLGAMGAVPFAGQAIGAAVLALSGGALVVCMAPSVLRASREDLRLALAAPGLLILRDVALGAGWIRGMLVGPRRILGGRPRPGGGWLRPTAAASGGGSEVRPAPIQRRAEEEIHEFV